MSNILKSTKLDIALVKPYFKTICFTLLLPIVFAAINRSLLTGVSFAMCFIAMTTGYTFSITEKNSMDRLFGILPVRKKRACDWTLCFRPCNGASFLDYFFDCTAACLESAG